MDYHVNRQGRTLGIFPLEELRNRRRSGEFNGSELVWTAGMPEWQRIDVVLQTAASPRPTPPPIPATAQKRQTSPVVPWLIGLAVIGFFAVMAFVAFQTAKAVKGFRGFTQQATTPTHTADPLAVVNRPLVIPADSTTETNTIERARAFRVRQWLEGYKQRGDRNPAYDALALKFLEAWIAQNYGDRRATTNSPDVQALAEQLATNAACKEPLLLSAAAANSIELHEATHRLERALSGFEQSHHRAYPKFYAAVTLATDLRDEPSRVSALDRSALDYLRDGFTDGSFQPEDQAELAEILINGWGSAFYARHAGSVVRAAHVAGSKYEWLALVLEGEHEVKEAWRARGNGWGSQVTTEGWQGFEQHLGQATKAFTKAWKLRPHEPLAPSRMISVAMGNAGLEEMRLWFDRTIAAQVDYPEAWSSMRWGLRPRWEGNLDAMLAFGVQAVETRRFDTDVPRKFMDVLGDLEAEQEIPAGRHIYGQDDIWPHLQEMYEGYVKEPKQAQWRDGWRSSYTAVAYLAGKYKVAHQQLEELNWKPNEQNLNGWERDLSLLPLEVAARTGSASNDIALAEIPYGRGSVQEALRSYSELAKRADLDERTRAFVQARAAALDMEKRLQSGEWVDFLPASNQDPDWVLLSGKCERLPDGGWEVESGAKGHMMYCRARVGSDFEVRGSFDVERSNSKAFQGGLLVGLPEEYAHDWDGFRLKRNDDEGDIVSFSYGWSKQQVSRTVELNDKHNTFEFRLQGGRATATVNGKEAFRNANSPHVPRIPRRQVLLGLGAFNDMNDTVICYRDIQVRKLSPSAVSSQNQ